MTALADFAARHRAILLRDIGKIRFGSLLGSVVIDLLAQGPDAESKLIPLYRESGDSEERVKFLNAWSSEETTELLAYLDRLGAAP